MAHYRFLGDEATLVLEGETILLNAFGQQVELDPAVVETHKRIPLITEEDFAACKFTDEEIEEHPSSSSLVGADPAFLTKRQQAITDWLEAVHAPLPPVPAEVVPETTVTPEQAADVQRVATAPAPVQAKTDTTPNPAPAVPPVKPAPVEQATNAGQQTDQEKKG